MRLIKKGTLKPDIFVGTCRHCGSEFEADRSELKVESGTQREPGEFAWAYCTVCHVGPYGGVLLYPKAEVE